jgi:glucokinase
MSSSARPHHASGIGDAVSAPAAVALDLGQTTLRGAIVDPDGSRRMVREEPSELHQRPEQILDRIIGLASELIAQLDRDEVAALGVSSTLDVDPLSGHIRTVAHPHLSQWQGLALRQLLVDRFGLPVAVENDGVAAAWGEWRAGAGRGAKGLLCITLGTGIGGGIVLDGQLHQASMGAAGYVGHITIDHDGPACPCGARGCWELYASGTALQQRLDASRAVLPPACQQGGIRQLAAEARRGNQAAQDVLSEYSHNVAVGLVSLSNVLNPDVIVVGGAVALSSDAFLRQVHQQLDERRIPLRDQIDLRPAELGAFSGVVGAGLLALAQSAQAELPAS